MGIKRNPQLSSANILPPRVFPGVLVWMIGALVVMVHFGLLGWMWGESDNPAPEDQVAEVTVEIIASRPLLVPSEVPDQPPEVLPEPELDPEPEPEPASEPIEPESEPIEPEPEPKADPEPKPISEPESDTSPEVPAEAPSVAPSPVEDLSVPIMNATHEADGLDNPVPAYPPSAYFDRLEGTVTLRVKVLPNGRVDEVVINESSGHGILDESAQSTIREWTFVPAQRDGSPITQWVEVPITFQLVEE